MEFSRNLLCENYSKICRRIQLSLNSDKNNNYIIYLFTAIGFHPMAVVIWHVNKTWNWMAGPLHEAARTFTIMHSWLILTMGNTSDKICRENQITCFMLRNSFFFRKSCHLWDNVKKYGTATQARGNNKIRRMRVSSWVNKARMQTRT